VSLGDLLVDLTALLVDPDKNAATIFSLLAQNQNLAEYEVARFLVAKVLAPHIEVQLRSLDPKERTAGVRSLLLVCPRSSAAKLLRPLVKDPDATTRKLARHAVRKLGIADVALRDPRYDTKQMWRIGPYTPGAYNPSGWAFGIYRRRLPKAQSPAATGLGLPSLSTREDVIKHLGIAGDEALSALLRPGTNPGSAYVEFEVQKATGGVRRIAAPRKPLRTVQRKIVDIILSNVPVHDAAHGFRRGRSTVTNATPHVGAAVVVKMDLVDFFPSIHYRRVVGLFERLGFATAASEALAGLCTYRPTLPDGTMVWPGVLPQGAPSSPAITNLICRRLDARLSALAKKNGAKYTRYADDLTFSFATAASEPAKLGRFLWWVDQICQQEGFTENTKKRRVFRKSGQQRVTGIVVNERLAIPRKQKRRFRAILANVKKNGVAAEASRARSAARAESRGVGDERGHADFEAYLHGFTAWVQMVEPALGARFATDLAAALGQVKP
jgi:retron-type reverse transcriptase